jgi:exopolysaccharide production protein ExoZ
MKSKNHRLHTFDYLRGMAAMSILVYHFSTWNFGPQSANLPVGRMGIYGVVLFYVLSGLTLRHVYISGWQNNWAQLRDFGIKRIFRIFPLLWVAVLASILVNQQGFQEWLLFLDLSGGFALLKWESNYALGAWSIGNELVFYLLFPLLMWAAKAGRAWLWTASAALLLPFVYITFFEINPGLPLDASWIVYSNPLNMAMLFMAGILIGEYTQSVQWSSLMRWLLLVSGLLLLFAYASTPDAVSIVYGSARLGITAGCLLICMAIYQWQAKPPAWLDSPLLWLGERSYSLYLLHPIFYHFIELIDLKLFPYGLHAPVMVRLPLAFGLTLVGSHLSYRYLEQPFMRLGKKWLRSSQPS